MDYPLVFIPGLFGSLGDDVIKGTGKFSFGLAEKIYRPFIKILNSMGYTEGENLFISYYDWKTSVLSSVDKYLFQDIEKIKKQTGFEKVIIISHSLGGLLARAYMTYFSSTSVDKLIMIGSPNLGAVDAYYFWSGGKLPYSKVEDNILYHGLKYGFILYYSIYESKGFLKAFRDIFPIAQDLLPSYGYGNYLYSLENGYREEIDINKMSIRNSFLNDLNKKFIDPSKIYIIAGRDRFTNMEFKVERSHKNKDLWADGKPIEEYQTDYGDGTVTTFSTLGNLHANSIIISDNHTNILYKSRKYLSDILGKALVEDFEAEEVEKIHVILASDCEELNIVTSDSNIISDKYMDIRDSRVQAVGLGNNNYWIMASGQNGLDVRVNTESKKSSKAKIYKKVFQR